MAGTKIQYTSWKTTESTKYARKTARTIRKKASRPIEVDLL